MNDEVDDMGPASERSISPQRKYIDPAEEAAAQAAQMWKDAVEFDWHAAMVQSGMDVDEAIRQLTAEYSAMWN